MISGAWQQALEEARRARVRFELGTVSRAMVGRAHYRKASCTGSAASSTG